MAEPDIERWSPLKVWVYSWFGRNPESNVVAVERLGVGPDDRFLDIGCGLGAALERAVAAGATVAGIDPSPSMVQRAHERVPQARVEVGSAESIPFPADSFTASMAVATFHHWADRDRGLAEVSRVVAPGGRFLIVEKHLDRGTGHGLTDDAADKVAARLTNLGFGGVETGELKAGRHLLVTVLATKPA
jgi:ubiquinone/menaquinone biosynthesis C-methylase UbiE